MDQLPAQVEPLTVTGADGNGSGGSSQAAWQEGPVEGHSGVLWWALAQLVQVGKKREVHNRERDVPEEAIKMFSKSSQSSYAIGKTESKARPYPLHLTLSIKMSTDLSSL